MEISFIPCRKFHAAVFHNRSKSKVDHRTPKSWLIWCSRLLFVISSSVVSFQSREVPDESFGLKELTMSRRSRQRVVKEEALGW